LNDASALKGAGTSKARDPLTFNQTVDCLRQIEPQVIDEHKALNRSTLSWQFD